MILLDLFIKLINYFSWKHQNLAAVAESSISKFKVKINSTYPQARSCQSSWTLPYMIFRPWSSDVSNSFFKFKSRLAVTANQRDGEAAIQEVSPFLSNSLTYHSQAWYIDSWRHPGDTQTIWWPQGEVNQEVSSYLCFRDPNQTWLIVVWSYPDDPRGIWWHLTSSRLQ